VSLPAFGQRTLLCSLHACAALSVIIHPLTVVWDATMVMCDPVLPSFVALPTTTADSSCEACAINLYLRRYLYLTDILPTAWHGTELGEVGPGDIVAIWGLGPGEGTQHMR
jgi:hypothetical protein